MRSSSLSTTGRRSGERRCRRDRRRRRSHWHAGAGGVAGQADVTVAAVGGAGVPTAVGDLDVAAGAAELGAEGGVIFAETFARAARRVAGLGRRAAIAGDGAIAAAAIFACGGAADDALSCAEAGVVFVFAFAEARRRIAELVGIARPVQVPPPVGAAGLSRALRLAARMTSASFTEPGSDDRVISTRISGACSRRTRSR